ncbi:MAG: hypothetical protein R3362_12960, partial [Rhodothermales bacterium]|nr:hypothetical protein [Rhodothermales bacterium]
GHRHVVGLSGDLHTYARYESADGRQRFVAGGGGAYLFPSHPLPERLALPTAPAVHQQEPEPFALGRSGVEGRPALFPPPGASRGLAARVLLFPRFNPGLSLFVGGVYLFLAWLLQSGSKTLNGGVGPEGGSLLEALAAGLPGPETLALFFDSVTHAPLAFLTVLVLFGGLVAFADCTGWRRGLLGLAHGAVHIVVLLLLTWAFAQVNLDGLGLAEDGLVQVFLFAAEMVVVGGMVGGLVFGVYLYLSHVLMGVHDNEVFAAQSIPDYKHVVRLRIDRRGGLTVFPIGIERVPKEWRYRPRADVGEAWFEPEGEPVAARAVLIEPPVRVAHGAAAGAGSPPSAGDGEFTGSPSAARG